MHLLYTASYMSVYCAFVNDSFNNRTTYTEYMWDAFLIIDEIKKL